MWPSEWMDICLFVTAHNQRQQLLINVNYDQLIRQGDFETKAQPLASLSNYKGWDQSC